MHSHSPRRSATVLCLMVPFFTAHILIAATSDDWVTARHAAESWRAQHRPLDLHPPLDYTPQLLRPAIRDMDAARIAPGVAPPPSAAHRRPHAAPRAFQPHK